MDWLRILEFVLIILAVVAPLGAYVIKKLLFPNMSPIQRKIFKKIVAGAYLITDKVASKTPGTFDDRFALILKELSEDLERELSEDEKEETKQIVKEIEFASIDKFKEIKARK